MPKVPMVNSQVNSYLNFAKSEYVYGALGTIIITSVVFNLIAPYVAQIPKVGEYQFLIYLISSFVVFMLAYTIFKGMKAARVILLGAAAGIFINGLLTIPAISNIRSQIDARARR